MKQAILLGIIATLISACMNTNQPTSEVSSTSTFASHLDTRITATSGLIFTPTPARLEGSIEFEREFNSEIWTDRAAALEIDSNLVTLRQRMVNDLVNNVLPGLTRLETISLLGVPDDSGVESEWVLLYRLAPEKAIGVDDMCLVIIFDVKDQYFKGYEIFNHCG